MKHCVYQAVSSFHHSVLALHDYTHHVHALLRFSNDVNRQLIKATKLHANMQRISEVCSLGDGLIAH